MNLNPQMRVTSKTVATCAVFMLMVMGLAAGEARGQAEGIGTGPDVTVIYLGSTSHYGEEGGVHGYSVGTTSCNIGNEPLWWCNDVGDPYCEIDQHPVIAQNLYRLSQEGRFEQLGMSWLKHGFLSTNTTDTACGPTCVTPPHGNDQLGLGCTDTYGSGLNGSRPLGLRSEVDPLVGTFPYPYTSVSSSGPYEQRVKVDESDLDPALNPGARYWVEGQYIAADDAEAGNAMNNASYREVSVNTPSYNLTLLGNTVREQPAIKAWQAVDPQVELHEVDVPAGRYDERFHAARKLTNNPDGSIHYEIALHNLQSSRAANRFTIEFAEPVEILNAGFADVKHHSGEPYSTEDWTVEVDNDAGTVTWFTDDFATNPNANALRWGTMFSFWFDTHGVPDGATHTLSMFTPGVPADVVIPFSSSLGIFADGFESGNTSSWTFTILP